MNKEVKESYQKLFDSDEGKIVLADIYRICKLDALSYMEGHADKTFFNEGAKFVALYIKKALSHSDKDVDKFIVESKRINNYNPYNLKGK